MKKLKRRIIGIVLTLAVVLGMMPAMSLTVKAIDISTSTLNNISVKRWNDSTNQHETVNTSGTVLVSYPNGSNPDLNTVFIYIDIIGDDIEIILNNVPDGLTGATVSFVYDGVAYNNVVLDWNGVFFATMVPIGSNPSGNSSSDDSSSNNSTPPTPPHIHTFEWVTITAMDGYHLGCEAYKCKECGAIQETRTLNYTCPVIDETLNEVDKLEKTLESNPNANTTITKDVGGYYFVNKALADKFTQNGKITLVYIFLYEKEMYKLTIPAGFNLSACINEDGYAGFMFIGAHKGTILEKISQ